MKIGIISLASEVHNPEQIAKSTQAVLAPLRQAFAFDEITGAEIHRVDFPIVFICTGGSEHLFKKIFPQLSDTGKPITLLATGSNNSLPAALEILYWITKQGIKNTLLLHGPTESLIEKIKTRARFIRIAAALKKMKIGVIGKPSDWLIASDIHYEKVRRKWGPTFTEIELAEVIANLDRYPSALVKETLLTFPTAQYCDGPSQQEIEAAARIYLALKKITGDYQLSALTLRCFDLLKPLNNTGCLALARLNDDGIPAGCEGDIPALFTMIVNHLLTGEPAFMANPSRITPGGVVFAHCTVPMHMVETFGYKTHFESGLGVGIAGKFAGGAMTISKINGEELDYYYAAAGEVIAGEESPHLCRTQVKIKIPQGYEYFFKAPLGNHHILSKGNHTESFAELMKDFSVVRADGVSGSRLPVAGCR